MGNYIEAIAVIENSGGQLVKISKHMTTLHPQYIKDANGQNALVILTIKAFNSLIEELEDSEDIKLYDEAKKVDTSKRILFSEYLKNRGKKNG